MTHQTKKTTLTGLITLLATGAILLQPHKATGYVSTRDTLIVISMKDFREMNVIIEKNLNDAERLRLRLELGPLQKRVRLVVDTNKQK